MQTEVFEAWAAHERAADKYQSKFIATAPGQDATLRANTEERAKRLRLFTALEITAAVCKEAK